MIFMIQSLIRSPHTWCRQICVKPFALKIILAFLTPCLMGTAQNLNASCHTHFGWLQMDNQDAHRGCTMVGEFNLPKHPAILPPVQKPPDICLDFNNGSMGEGTVNNLIPSFLKPGPGGKDDMYLSLLDAPNESYLKVPPNFLGDWRPARDCSRMLCYDVLITNDGMVGTSLNYPIGVHVYGANGSHFRYCPTTIPMTEPAGAHPGWHSVCAPIAEVMPPGWTQFAGSTGTWSDLISNVTAIRFGFDVGPYQTEVFGIDNICLKTSCSPPPCK
jgi:hypothetical protein